MMLSQFTNRARTAIVCLLLFSGQAFAASPDDSTSSDSTVSPRANLSGSNYPQDWNSKRVEEPVMGSTLHLVTAGNPQNPALVLVHGLGQNGLLDWRRIIEALKDDYYIIAPDLPGFGRSSSGSERLSPANYARLLRWLVQAHELDDFHLAGHSMGGAIALYYAAHYPEQLSRLTLINAAGVLHRAAFVKSMASLDRRDYGFLPDPLQRTATRILNIGDEWVEKINLLPDFTQLLRQSDLAWDALLSDRPNTSAALSLINTDYSYLLEIIKTPTTIIWGERDPIAPVRSAYLLHGALENSQLHVIADAEHVTIKSHVGKVVALMRATWRDDQSPIVVAEPGHKDLNCQGLTGGRYSGRFRHVVLDGCVNVRLVDVQADSVEVRSSTAEFIGLTVNAEGSTALQLDNATVHVTDARLHGAVALQLNASRVDMAGVHLQAEEAAIDVNATSVIIASVSESQSPRYRGKLHGAVRAVNTVGEVLSQLQSRSEPP